MTLEVSLTGAQTIREAADTAELLRDAVAKGEDLTLDCTGITEADLSFVQLVIAAQKSLAAKGHSVALSAPAQGALLAVLDKLGIGPAGNQGFWFAGAP